MWPPGVEEVAAAFRAAGVDARLEELPPDAESFPGPAVRVEAFDCDGGRLVALVPEHGTLDPRKLPCREARPVDAPSFPFRRATVLVDRLLLTEPVVWMQAGSPRHVAGLSPALLAQLLRAQAIDLVAEG
ncbi:MAG TPA: hypothetical protein VEH52_07785 [Gaiellaceae bacterium]|nr:hypothetical protein [Gaiellaceae bacterium]